MSSLRELAARLAEVTLSGNAGAYPVPLARTPLRRSGLPADGLPTLEYEIPPEYEGLFRPPPMVRSPR